MARYDKYDPIANGFRAAIYQDFPDANLGKVYGVGLNASGQVVIGSGQSGIIGLLVITQKPGRVGPLKEVPVIDVMRKGCITDFGPTAGNPGVDFGVAGTPYFSDASGIITATPADGSFYVGTTVEPDRLEANVLPLALVKGMFGLAT
jgi:hypothetical protein